MRIPRSFKAVMVARAEGRRASRRPKTAARRSLRVMQKVVWAAVWRVWTIAEEETGGPEPGGVAAFDYGGGGAGTMVGGL